MKLRLYLGQLDDKYIEVTITEEEWNALLKYKKVNIDDGGVKFVELILEYPRN